MRFFFVLALGALAATSCAATSGVAANDIPECRMAAYERRAPAEGPTLVNRTPGSITDVPLDAVVYTDPWIRRAVVVQSVSARRTEAATVEVIARYQNCTGSELKLSSRTAFLDGDQAPAEPKSAWKGVFIPPYSMETYAEKSVGTIEVTNFLIELRGDR